jgi:nucleotide-binding universal stress UspA family protein
MGFTKILVPLDGSELAETALDLATAVAAPNAHIHLLSVVTEAYLTDIMPTVYSPMNAGFDLSKQHSNSLESIADPRMMHERTLYLEEVADRLRNRGHFISTEVEPGQAVTTITDVAANGFNLVVMATHGRTGLSKLILGSVAEGVLHKAPCPVLLAPVREGMTKGDKETKIDSILVSLDGSAQSETVLPAVETLLQTHPAKVVLLRVGPQIDLNAAAHEIDPYIGSAVDLPGDDYGLLSNAAEHQIRKYLDAIAEVLARQGATPFVEVSFNKPAEEIVFFAKYHKADLIAMATHGRTGLNRVLHGSVTESVLHHAACPILIVHTEDPAASQTASATNFTVA